VTVLWTLDNPLRPLADARALAGMIRLCRGFDIVHTHSTKAGVLGRLAAAICRAGGGLPRAGVIHTIHAVPFDEFQRPLIRFLARWAERIAARWSDRLVSIGDTLAEDFAHAGVCSRERIVTIRSGIDFSRFDVAVDRAAGAGGRLRGPHARGQGLPLPAGSRRPPAPQVRRPARGHHRRRAALGRSAPPGAGA
jgi:glycosyltransferase involved in cell wall biosynthesis